MANPVAAHTFDFIHIYLSTRTGGAPGSGTWSVATVLFDGKLNGSFVDATTFSAGALGGGDPYGIISQTDNAARLAFLGNGIPAVPVQIAVGGDQFEASDYWDMSQGAWTIGGNLYALVSKNPNSGTHALSVIKSTDGGTTWAYMDAANQPGTSRTVAVQRVDGKIVCFVAVTTPSNGNAFYTFDTATDTWGPQVGFFANFPLNDLGARHWSNGVYLFANGDMGVLYDHDSSGAGTGCVYQLYSAGSAAWGTEQYFPGQEYASSLMDPSLTFLHVFTYGTFNDLASSVHYSTVTHSGTITPDAAVIPAASSSGQSDGVGHPSIQNGMIFVPRDDFADFDNAVWVATLPATAFFKEELPIPPGESGVINGPSDVQVNGTGSGYLLHDTGTINGGASSEFLAQYKVNSAGGGIKTDSLNNSGVSYLAGDVVTVNGSGSTVQAVIDTVDGGGAVLTYHLNGVGGGYTVGVAATTGGTGHGFQINILSVYANVGAIQILNGTGNGGYSIASGVATTTGGSQPGVGTGLTIDILSVHGKTPCCAYMMFPNGYSLTAPPLSFACPIGGGTGTIGVPYSAQLIASGGTPPYIFSIVS